MTATTAPPPVARRRSRVRRWSARLARAAAFVYLSVVLILSLLQTRLIFPGTATCGLADAVVRPLPGQELVRLTTRRGAPIVALYGGALTPDGAPRGDAARRPTVLFFYGNAACVNYSTDQFDGLRRLGCNVIVPEYEGYGMSGGTAGEQGCYAAADAAYDYLLTRGDVDPTKLVAVGWSLGSGVAVDLASRRPVAGLMTFSGFSSMTDMGRRVLPWFPTSLLLRHKFDNAAKIGRVSVPVFLAHGTEDDIVPFDMCGVLERAARSNVTRVNVEGAHHNDLFECGGEVLWGKIGAFVEGL